MYIYVLHIYMFVWTCFLVACWNYLHKVYIYLHFYINLFSCSLLNYANKVYIWYLKNMQSQQICFLCTNSWVLMSGFEINIRKLVCNKYAPLLSFVHVCYLWPFPSLDRVQVECHSSGEHPCRWGGFSWRTKAGMSAGFSH